MLCPQPVPLPDIPHDSQVTFEVSTCALAPSPPPSRVSLPVKFIPRISVVDPDPDPGSGSVLDPYSIGPLDPDPDP